MATVVKRPTGREEILDAVLDAAERLFAAAGPADVSLRAIAHDAGVNYGLFDRLLQRYAERWTARFEVLDYQAAFDELLGPGPETGPYLRLLAWTLLSDRQDGHARAPTRPATL